MAALQYTCAASQAKSIGAFWQLWVVANHSGGLVDGWMGWMDVCVHKQRSISYCARMHCITRTRVSSHAPVDEADADGDGVLHGVEGLLVHRFDIVGIVVRHLACFHGANREGGC